MSIADDFATLRAACPYPHERAAIYRIEFELSRTEAYRHQALRAVGLKVRDGKAGEAITHRP